MQLGVELGIVDETFVLCMLIYGAKPLLNGLLDVVNIDFKVETSAALAMKEITDRFIRLGTESD